MAATQDAVAAEETLLCGARAIERLRQAVHRHKAVTRQGIQERLFTLAFSGLVYPQIWEDPVVDLEALGLKERRAARRHRVGRLQRAELPRRRAGRRSRPSISTRRTSRSTS